MATISSLEGRTNSNGDREAAQYYQWFGVILSAGYSSPATVEKLKMYCVTASYLFEKIGQFLQPKYFLVTSYCYQSNY